MSMTITEMADRAFSPRDRVRTPDGRAGIVTTVNVHKGGVITVRHDGEVNITPYMFFELTSAPDAPVSAPAAAQCRGCLTSTESVWASAAKPETGSETER